MNTGQEPFKQKNGSLPYSKVFEAALVGIVIVVIALVIQALLVMVFWNLSLPYIFSAVPCISFWQALMLVLLLAVLPL